MIHLQTARERLVFQKQQFEQLGLDFEILPAVSVSDITKQQYQKQAFGWQRPLREVELACFFSHKSAWEKVLELSQPCLILEDDAILAKNSGAVLKSIEQKQFSDIDLINLEVRSRKKIISKQKKLDILKGEFQLFELYQDRTGAAGYVLYPSGAKKLLARLKQTAPAIADGFICASYELKNLQIEPALVIQQDQMQAYDLDEKMQFASTIGRSEHYKPVYSSLAEKIKFKKRRIIGQLAMALRYLQVLPKATKRFITLEKKYFI